MLLLLTVSVHSQTPADDAITFNAAVDWLNSKLDYVYYDEASERWWTNTFYINDVKVVTIKQISSKVRITADIKSKNYTIRTFSIKDINPFTIDIKEVNESTGRFAKGQLLEIRTFDGEPKIHKSVNNRKATSTSYLHLSFPSTLTDSLSNYPELVKQKLIDAVRAATRIYASDSEKNHALIMETLKGHYHSEHGEKWISTERFHAILKFESEGMERFFGYDSNKSQYYLTTISSQGVQTEHFNIKPDDQLILEGVNDRNQRIFFETTNSFQINGEWFYRQ